MHCLSPRTNLCLAIREQQNKGYLPDGTARLSRDGEPIRHFMGTSTFAEYTVMPEIALAKVYARGAAGRRACLFACGLSTGLGAAINTAKVEPGSTCVVFGAGMVGLGAVAGCRLQGAERIVCVDMSRASGSSWPAAQGATDTMVGGDDVVERIVEMTGGFGADYTFEATGNVGGDAPGGRVGAHGLGPVHRRRRRRQGRDAGRHPALPDHRPPRRRLARSAASRAATRCRSWSSASWPARSTSTRSSPTASRSTRSTTASS